MTASAAPARNTKFRSFFCALVFFASLPAICQAATLELVDRWGEPASEFDFVRPLRMRVTDAAVGSAGTVDQVSVLLSAPTGDLETVICRETGRTSGIFEGELQAYDFGGFVANDGGLQLEGGGLATALYSPAGGGDVTAQATARRERLAILGAGGAPVAALPEGGTLRVELIALVESLDLYLPDTVQVMVERSGGDSETISLLETGNYTGIFKGSLPLAKNGQFGPGVLDRGELPATVTVTYQRTTFPLATVTASADMKAGLIEIVDAFGRPTAVVSGQLRVRVTEPFFHFASFEPRFIEVNDGASLDVEWLQLLEPSPGVYEAAVPLADTAASPGDGILSASAGSTVNAIFAGYQYGLSDTVSAVVAASVDLMDGDWQPADSFLLHQPLGLEVRFAGGNLSATVRDTVTAELWTDLSADFETVLLSETAADSGVFRAKLSSVHTAGAAIPGNGILEEGTIFLQGAPVFDGVHTSFSAGGFTAADDASIAGAARFELIGAAGLPARRFSSGETVKIRVTDFSVPDDQGSIDSVLLEAWCGTQDFEPLLLNEKGGTSFTFETDLPLRFAPVMYQNHRLECAAAGDLHFSFTDVTGASVIETAELTESAIAFVDAAGQPTSEVVDGRRARLRVTAWGANLQPNAFDTVTVEVAGQHTGDEESLELRETTLSSGIFEGELWISSQASGAPRIAVTSGPAPLFSHDRVTASFGAVAAEAEVLVARLTLVDVDGRELTSVLPGSTIYARLEMPNLGSAGQPDLALAHFGASSGGLQSWQLYETGANSGIFVGSYYLGNFTLAAGQLIGAFFTTPDFEVLRRVVPVVAYQVNFLDENGARITTLPANRPVHLELVRPQQLDDPGQIEQLEVKLGTAGSEDLESLILTETEPWSATFRGSLPLLLAPPYAFDGTLEPNSGFPFGDIVRVELAGSPGILGSAPLRSPRIVFRDAAGQETTQLVARRTYTVEVEDPTRDLDPDGADSFYVSLYSDNYPVSVLLHETGVGNGIFRGSFFMTSYYGFCPGDGVPCIFMVPPGATLVARHALPGESGWVEARGLFGWQTLELVDGQGNSVDEVLEGAPIRVRLVDPYHQTNVTVLVGSRRGGDLETLVLWETGSHSGIFERTLPTRFLPSGATGDNNDGELTLAADPQSAVSTGEAVVLSYDPGIGDGPIEARVPTIAARFSVLDHGQPAVAVLSGNYQPRTLRLECPSLAAAGLPATFEVAVPYGDVETFTTSAGAGGIFEVEVRFTQGWDYPQNGIVAVYPGSQVNFTHRLTNGHAGELNVVLPVAGAILRFADALSGAALETAADLRPFKVQLVEFQNSEWEVETRSATLTTALGHDLETVQLVETGAATGVFEAIVSPRLATALHRNGVFEVSRRPSPAGGIYDVVTATMIMGGSTQVSAALPLASPRALWTDAAGRPVDEIAIGGLAHVLVDDPLLNQNPAQVDTYSVHLDDFRTAGENLTLAETGVDTGIFRGSLPVVGGYPPPAGYGALEPYPGSQVELRYQMPVNGIVLTRRARVLASQLTLLDAAGQATTTYIEGETLRLRLLTSIPGSSPTVAEQVQVEVRSLYWGLDSEWVTLTETTPTSGIFEGTLATHLELAPGPSQSADGILQIGRGATLDAVLASYEGTSAQASFSAGRLRFFDRLGRYISRLAAGQVLGVELTRLTGNDPQQVDTLAGSMLVEIVGTPYPDSEMVTLVETAANSGIFRGQLPITDYPGAPVSGDGKITINYQGSLHARYQDGAAVLDGSLEIFYDQAPYAGPDYLQLAAGSSGSVDVLANDVDPEGTPLLLGAATGGPFTSVAVNPDGTLTVTAAPGANGYEMVTYLISDAAGLIGEGQVSIQFSSAPAITILGPATGTVFAEQGEIPLTASASDLDDGDLSGSIEWTSDLQGYFGFGGNVLIPAQHALPGTHLVTASVTDSQGHTASATLTIVVDAGPTLAITSPDENTWLLQEGANTLTATAADAEQGDLGAAISWSSTAQGNLGSGAVLPVVLVPGYDQFTAAVTDSAGNTASATRSVLINGRPTIAMVDPVDGAVVPQAAYLEVFVTVDDPDEEELAIDWFLDGELVSTSEWPRTALPNVAPGPHQLTARVRDQHHGEASASASFTVVTAPTVEITAPADYAVFGVGDTIAFAATAGDLEDGDLSAQIVWSSNLQGQIGVGATLSTAVLSYGAHTITAAVEDGDGLPASATVHVDVRAVPTVSIANPADGATFPVGAEVILHGIAGDLAEGDLSSEIVWSSSRDGALGTGASVVTSSLSAGAHTITARIANSHGLQATATVAITLSNNTAPTLTISSPAAGGSTLQGTAVTLAGSASDPEDGNLSAQIAWSSSRDGALGTGGSLVTSTLSVGSHLLTATVTDSRGTPASATRTFTITANTAPVVAISSPTSGVWVAVGDSVTFTGSATDAESGNLSASLAWSSSLAGALGSGASITTSGLGLGSHTITATVADPLGLAGSATITVVVKVVQAATFVSAGALDGFVLESGETTNVGGLASNGQLRLGDNLADRQYRSILSFDTSALPDTIVIRKVTVKAQRSGTTGTNPATTHGNLSADVKTGFFGASTTLENADFQDTPTAAGTCLLTPGNATGQWTTGIFDAAGRAAISLDATTQVRLQFSLDDDDDATNDYLDHYGGESTVASTRPQLVVEYLQ